MRHGILTNMGLCQCPPSNEGQSHYKKQREYSPSKICRQHCKIQKNKDNKKKQQSKGKTEHKREILKGTQTCILHLTQY